MVADCEVYCCGPVIYFALARIEGNPRHDKKKLNPVIPKDENSVAYFRVELIQFQAGLVIQFRGGVRLTLP